MSVHDQDDGGGDDGQGPFRDNASPPKPPRPMSTPAVAALPCVLGGWFSLWLAVEGVEIGRVAGILLLALGGMFGLFGLMDTRPTVIDGGADVLEPKRGRPLAKLALGVLLGPIVLACVGFGLLLLTCMGH